MHDHAIYAETLTDLKSFFKPLPAHLPGSCIYSGRAYLGEGTVQDSGFRTGSAEISAHG